jgi:ABC-2 type transport system permease protein
MTMSEIVDYVWLGQAMFAILPWTVDAELACHVRSGAVAYELLRPLDLYTLWFASALAFRTAPMSLRCIPLVIVAMMVLPWLSVGAWALHLPPSLPSALLFALSFGLAILLSTCITMLMHLSLLWTLSSQGIDRVTPAITVVLSGMVVPLPLFPDWLQPLLWLQPFRGLVDVPFRIYSGNMSPSLACVEIMGQLFWIIALVSLGRFFLARGTRKLVVQGG